MKNIPMTMGCKNENKAESEQKEWATSKSTKISEPENQRYLLSYSFLQRIPEWVSINATRLGIGTDYALAYAKMNIIRYQI